MFLPLKFSKSIEDPSIFFIEVLYGKIFGVFEFKLVLLNENKNKVVTIKLLYIYIS